VHVVSVPRSRDLQNTFLFIVFPISTVNILWTDCEYYIMSRVFIVTLHHKPAVNSTVWWLEAFQYSHAERILSYNVLSIIHTNNFNNAEQ